LKTTLENWVGEGTEREKVSVHLKICGLGNGEGKYRVALSFKRYSNYMK